MANWNITPPQSPSPPPGRLSRPRQDEWLHDWPSRNHIRSLSTDDALSSAIGNSWKLPIGWEKQHNRQTSDQRRHTTSLISSLNSSYTFSPSELHSSSSIYSQATSDFSAFAQPFQPELSVSRLSPSFPESAPRGRASTLPRSSSGVSDNVRRDLRPSASMSALNFSQQHLFDHSLDSQKSYHLPAYQQQTPRSKTYPSSTHTKLVSRQIESVNRSMASSSSDSIHQHPPCRFDASEKSRHQYQKSNMIIKSSIQDQPIGIFIWGFPTHVRIPDLFQTFQSIGEIKNSSLKSNLFSRYRC